MSGKISRIRFFQDDDTCIVSDLPSQLAVADVDSKDSARSLLKQTVSKTAGRCADVKRDPALANNSKVLDRSFKLDSAASNVTTAGGD